MWSNSDNKKSVFIIDEVLRQNQQLTLNQARHFTWTYIFISLAFSMIYMAVDGPLFTMAALYPDIGQSL